jgi:hypothetical protein
MGLYPSGAKMDGKRRPPRSCQMSSGAALLQACHAPCDASISCRHQQNAWKALSGLQVSVSKWTGSICAAGVTPGAFGIGCTANLS